MSRYKTINYEPFHANTYIPLNKQGGLALQYSTLPNFPISYSTTGSSGGTVDTNPGIEFSCAWFEHPYVSAIAELLDRSGIEQMLAFDPSPSLRDAAPQVSALVPAGVPLQSLQFGSSDPYSIYNWELFFHAPLMIADHLKANGRFAEAQKWLHYILNPTLAVEKWWRVKPFKGGVSSLKTASTTSLLDLSTCADAVDALESWRETPFQPHAVAKYRQSAYMHKTAMSYLDNLIEWGDSLFRQGTRETINEAVQLYILAGNLLGPMPKPPSSAGASSSIDYLTIRNATNTLIELEVDLPFDRYTLPTAIARDERVVATRSLGSFEAFWVPPNRRLYEYWDTVADRLFKIRNSQDIDGNFTSYLNFEPPINPALLAKAAAAGVNIEDVYKGITQGPPLLRFHSMLQFAEKLCGELKALGSHLLSATQQDDAENLAVLRNRHEYAVLEMADNVKYRQLQEAVKSREGVESSLIAAAARRRYYNALLGKDPEQIPTTLDELDLNALESEAFGSLEQALPTTDISVEVVGEHAINSYEAEHGQLMRKSARAADKAAEHERMAGVYSIIPGIATHCTPLGVGISLAEVGGPLMAAIESFAASSKRSQSAGYSYEASVRERLSTYLRREQDWEHQRNQVGLEINQTYKQYRAAQIRESIAELEWKNHKRQMGLAKDIEVYLDEKRAITTKDFAWIKKAVRSLFRQCYDLAIDAAQKAQAAMRYEMGDDSLSYINVRNIAGNDGLLEGERLSLELSRMASAYNDLNVRRYELTKHVSLLELDPLALIDLRLTGTCNFSIPEELFDMDAPGHYCRRLKTVSLSMPCIVGPYTSIHAKLTRNGHDTRRKPTIPAGRSYAKASGPDDRFSTHVGTGQSVVTSSAINDSGMFELNFHDERFLPFEGDGAIGAWKLELPNSEIKQFDYGNISDVVIHLKYTALDGGEEFRKKAVDSVKSLVAVAGQKYTNRLFSLRHEFSDEWARMQASGLSKFALTLSGAHFPYWLGAHSKISKCTVNIRGRLRPGWSKECKIAANTVTLSHPVDELADPNLPEEQRSIKDVLRGSVEFAGASRPSRDGKLEINCSNFASIEDIWLDVGIAK